MNNKGFVLMETLVVTLFTLFTFSLLYNNAVPLLGKYQELEYFNDLDTTYDLYHIKKFITSFFQILYKNNTIKTQKFQNLITL